MSDDAGMPVPHERHTEEVVVRMSPRLLRAVERAARTEETSVSELVRDALEGRADWMARAMVAEAAAAEYREERDEATRALAEQSAVALLTRDLAEWLVGLDDPAVIELRRMVTLEGIIDKARAALGLPDAEF